MIEVGLRRYIHKQHKKAHFDRVETETSWHSLVYVPPYLLVQTMSLCTAPSDLRYTEPHTVSRANLHLADEKQQYNL